MAALIALALVAGPLLLALPAHADAVVVDEEEDEEEEEDEGLRQRLTEREDQRRPLRPWTADVFGNPLTLSGEYELEFEYVRQRVFDPDEDDRADRTRIESQIEVEAFYTLGEPLSFFLQGKGVLEEDPNPMRESFDSYFERGEMWIASEDIGGSDVSFDIGRLDFEDERRWWWDEELDAVRLIWEPTDGVEIGLALAQELTSVRSDRGYVEPEQEDVLRVLGVASWSWREDQLFELFGLYTNDHSGSQADMDVADEREDDTDGRLSWLGVRALGVLGLGEGGLLGYWFDAGLVRGTEREIFDRGEPTESVERHDVSGTAFDVGASWILPFDCAPRLFGGYARGSREYQQSNLQANEAGFGGVERFPSYGLLLAPELSNIGVVTAGVGVALLRSSSLDLVYHEYQRVDPERGLRDANLDASLDERHHDVGHGIDLVLALEEWERLEFTFAVGALRAGDAFTDRPNTWSYGGFAAIRYAF